jgi:CheY-like chemotaxis protein
MENKWILLVEDNADDEELTRRALKKNKILNELIVARDGVEALDYLLGSGNHAGHNIDNLPAVVLLDLKLPRIDGIEVLRRLRENKKTALIPVVILTSSKEEQDIANAYKSGCNSYIRKPVDFTQFNEAIQNMGLYWLLLNEPPVKQTVS